MLLLLPTVAVEAGGRAAWMVAIISGISGFAILLIVGKLSQRFPGLTLPEYAELLLGKWPGKALALLLTLNFGLNSSVDVGVAMRNLQGTYFAVTPGWVISGLLALTALSFVWFGLVSASRLAPTILALLVVTFLVTFPLLWRWMKPGYMIPLFDLSPVDPTSPSFWVAVGVVRAALFPVAFLPYLAEPQKAVRILGWAHWVGMFGNFLAVITPVMVFGPLGASAIVQPFPFVMAVLRIPIFPLDRLELIGRLAFHINTIYAIASIYFTGGLFMAKVFGTPRVRPFMLVMAGLSLAPIIFIPSTIHQMAFAYSSVIRGLIVGAVTFPLLWVAYWLRRPKLAAGAGG